MKSKLNFINLIVISLTLYNGICYASSGHSAEHAIPYKTIFWQAVNVFTLFGVLGFFLKDKAREFFRSRRAVYEVEAEKFKSVMESAEQALVKVKHEMEKLENNRDENLSRAEAEAAILRDQLVQEAQTIAKKIAQETETNIQNEIQKRIHHIQQDFVRGAIDGAKQVLNKDVSANDHQRLQSEFTKTVEAMQL